MTPTGAPQPDHDDAELAERALPPHPVDRYFCGPENTRGLRATCAIRGDRIVVRFTGDDSHQGGVGMLHGGVIAALFDEALGAVAPETLGIRCATGTLTVIYRQPAPTGQELVIEAWHERVDGRKVHLAATACVADALIAEATATFIQLPESHFKGGYRSRQAKTCQENP